jgi:hypothetical protein
MIHVQMKYQGQPGAMKPHFDFSEQQVKVVLTYPVFT